KKQQILSELKETWIQIAVQRYREEQEKGRSKRKGLRTICSKAKQECYEQTRQVITIDKQTVKRRADGGMSIQESNAWKGWLHPEEE
ncbi:hypothetical protein K474DRAFT_1556872, partial [Panus rudis PR-1116 ss-1]